MANGQKVFGIDGTDYKIGSHRFVFYRGVDGWVKSSTTPEELMIMVRDQAVNQAVKKARSMMGIKEAKAA